jgi:hypothetical protein
MVSASIVLTCRTLVIHPQASRTSLRACHRRRVMWCSCSTCLSQNHLRRVGRSSLERWDWIGYVGSQMRQLDGVLYAHFERCDGSSLLLPPIAPQTTLSVAGAKAGWTRGSSIFFVKTGPMGPSMTCVGHRLTAKALHRGGNVSLQCHEITAKLLQPGQIAVHRHQNAASDFKLASHGSTSRAFAKASHGSDLWVGSTSAPLSRPRVGMPRPSKPG